MNSSFAATVDTSAELLGAPTAVWALWISLLSFGIAASALGWQIIKHFLDGGRVRVYLNTAVLEPDFMLATNPSGYFVIENNGPARSVTHGRAIELAQLVVENPGKVPVTIYSPGLYFSGHGKKRHMISPRRFQTEESYGSDQAIMDSKVRIEPYDRVTFLLDYWSVIPGIFKQTPKRSVALRGYVGVAGRSKRPQRSSWKLRWRIKSGMYTAIIGSPKFTPFAIIWREMYRRLPEDDKSLESPGSGLRLTRGMAQFIVDTAMSQFTERPSQKDFEATLKEVSEREGYKLSILASYVYEAYQALDQMEEHLSEWTDGLRCLRRRQRKCEGQGLSIDEAALERDDH